MLSTAIDKYVYVNINKKFDGGIRLAYSKTEEVDRLADVEHKLVRAVFEMMKVDGGVEITTIADIPSRGTGLGSSSTFTVGLINVLSAYLGRHISADELGRQSCHVEIELCGEPIGKQDQYAAAFGGLNLIEFHPDDSVLVTPVVMSGDLRRTLERRIVAFYTGITRSASDLLRQQSLEIVSNSAVQAALRRMVALTYQLRDKLCRGDLDAFGHILDENWKLKKVWRRASATTRLTAGTTQPWTRARSAVRSWAPEPVASSFSTPGRTGTTRSSARSTISGR